MLSEEELSTTTKPFVPGYHMVEIPKGVLGEPTKIVEELHEFVDAVNQGSAVMALIELSDLLGAIEAYVAKYNMSLHDLNLFSEITKRAFRNGARS